MIYKTEKRFVVELDDDVGYLSKSTIIKKRLELLNSGRFLDNRSRLDSEVLDTPEIRKAYFGTLRIPIDVTHARNLKYLKREHDIRQHDAFLEDKTLKELQQNSKYMTIALAAKNIQNHVVSVAPNGWFGQDKNPHLKNINIVESFDFDTSPRQIFITVYLDFDHELSLKEQHLICSHLDGAMSDGWGENYDIADDPTTVMCVDGYNFFDDEHNYTQPENHEIFIKPTDLSGLWLDRKMISLNENFDFLIKQ